MRSDALAELLAARIGPFTYAELRRYASSDGIAGALARGELTRILPDLFAPAAHAESWHVRAAAAAAWAPAGGAVTGVGALFAWQAIEDAPRQVHLVVPRGCHRPSPPWLRVTSQTHPIETALVGGDLRVAWPDLAMIHAYGTLPVAERDGVLFSACASGVVDPGRTALLLERLPRARARRALQQALALAGDGVESYLEDRARSTVLTGAQFVEVVRQHRVRAGGRSYRLDAYHPPTQTAFEFDGAASHSAPDARMGDLRRDANLAGLGIQTVRYSYWDVVNRPEWCRATALATIRSRGRGLRAA